MIKKKKLTRKITIQQQFGLEFALFSESVQSVLLK